MPLPEHRDQMLLHVQAPSPTLILGKWEKASREVQMGEGCTHRTHAGRSRHGPAPTLRLGSGKLPKTQAGPFPSQDLGPTCKAVESAQLSHGASCLTFHTGVPRGTRGRRTAGEGEVPLPVGPKPGLSSHTAPRESRLKGD